MHQLCRLAEGRGRGWGWGGTMSGKPGRVATVGDGDPMEWSDAAWRRQETPDRIRWYIIKRNNLLVLQCIHLVAGYTMQEEVALQKQSE